LYVCKKFTFTNIYNVSFDNVEILGIADDSYDFYGQRVFMDWTAFWSPVRPDQLSN
jgi:hypothetical protein